MMRRNIAGMCLLVAGMVIGQVKAAEGMPVPLKQGEGAIVGLEGTHRLTCKSQWRNVDLKSKLSAKLTLGYEELRQLIPERMSEDQKSQVSDKHAEAFGRKVFKALKLTPSDKQQWDRWIGSGDRPGPENIDCHLERQPVTKANDDGMIDVSLKGKITVSQSGRMSSRYGPNGYNQTWSLDVHVSAYIDEKGELADLSVVLSGTVNGDYGPDEKYSAKVMAKSRSNREMAEARKEFESLLKELAHAKSKVRKAALAKAKKLPLPKRLVLIDLLVASSDPELRHVGKSLPSE